MLMEPAIASSPNGLSAAKRALLEKRLRDAQKTDAARPAVLRRPGAVRTPLSFAQQRLWFFDQLEPNSPLYNLPTALRLRGRLNRDALQRALNTIVARHEVLRAKFEAEDGNPVQIIGQAAPVELPVIDLSQPAASPREAGLQRWLDQEARRPFDLSRGGLVRAGLARLGEVDHAFLITMHHIVSDAWSLDVFFRELALFYEAFDQGREPALPELPVQYADFAAWQRDGMQGRVMEEQLAFWKEGLAGVPQFLELPADKPNPPVQSFRGAHVERRLPKPLGEELKRLGRAEAATLFMTLLAAFKVLLHRYTGQTRLIVGSPVAGRSQLETEGLIGFFVNTLALHTDLSGNPTFREALARVRRATLDGFARTDLPFERLVEELQPARHPGRTPLVQALFTLQTEAARNFKLPRLAIEPLTADTGTSKFDLTLAVEEGRDGLRLEAEYSTDLFTEATMARMLGHFQTLLEGIVANPSQKIGELPLLTVDERRKVLVEWNPVDAKFSGEKCLHRLFEEQTQRTPEAIAIVFEGQRLSYADLNRRANRLANRLRSLGVGPEVMVGLCLDRSVEMIVALLGILKAGGAYVPLEPAWPAERLSFVLQDAQVSVLVTQKALRERLPVHAINVVCLEHEFDEQTPADEQDPKTAVRPENLAYVIYTSGSTGRPKGVLVTHRNVARLFEATQPWYQFSGQDTWTCFHSVAFDFSVWEIWGALLFGGRLVLVPYLTSRSPETFLELLARERVTVLNQTPSAFRQLIQAESQVVPPPELSLRLVIFGGEALEMQSLKPWFDRHGDRQPQLINMYGITETTVHVTYRPIGIKDLGAGSLIGAPIPDLQVYILDTHRQPVPVGVRGELYVGGTGVARGYLNRPELTAERFISDPFSNAPKARLYKTGDLGRRLADGDLEFLGRIDNQVKIRGHRIELGEIESVLGQHPAVRECAAVLREDAPGDRRLTAYVVADSGRVEATFRELRDFLNTKLPGYMIPSAFVRLASLPLNGNGKLDRNSLPPPDGQRSVSAEKFVAPRDRLEAQLVKIWEEVLEINPVGMEDQFFDLGGHSLLAVRLIARIEKALGKKIPVAAVFQSPTVAKLAEVLRQKHEATPASSLVEIQPKGAQPRLFFVHGVGGGMFWGYTNLARYLGTDQPVFAFKSRGMDGLPEFATIEEMAAHYIADLRAFQPHGPYRLGGYCFGGNVAYEMARQLQSQGEEISLLALINCAPPNSGYAHFRLTLRSGLKFLKNLGCWVGYFWQMNPRQRREAFIWKIKALKKRLGRCCRPSRIDVEEIVDLAAQPEDRRQLWEAHVRALIAHRTKPYPGEVTLFRTRGHPMVCSFDDEFGWREFAAGVSVHIIPGAHESILDEPHVRTMAKAMRACLQGIQHNQDKGNTR
ncbi:MAG TPA: amino acid adenylation domain-containing protein [Candidatus Acidoferrum sp.]|jgi:amino acid adenylation domain-containing protein|nr:amino acid adenylation domain-containing protein [Candidatus Acidoferrum sp.]